MVDQLLERVTDDSGFSLIAFLDRLEFAPKIFDLDIAFDDSLIAATSKRQIQCSIRVGFCLCKILASGADTDTQACRKVRACFQMSDFIENIKLCRSHLFQILLLKPDEIGAVAHSADRCVDPARPFADQLVDFAGERQTRRRPCVADQLIVIVDLNLRDAWFLGIVSVFELL